MPLIKREARPQAVPTGTPIDTGHYRVRHDRIDSSGVVTLRHNSRLHHIGPLSGGALRRRPRWVTIIGVTITAGHNFDTVESPRSGRVPKMGGVDSAQFARSAIRGGGLAEPPSQHV
jgi:hypothetical protein